MMSSRNANSEPSGSLDLCSEFRVRRSEFGAKEGASSIRERRTPNEVGPLTYIRDSDSEIEG